MGAPVTESGAVRPLFHMLKAVLKQHGATFGPMPTAPPVAAYGKVVMTSALSLWRAVEALAPHPNRSSTVRTMEEMGQGYGYILYSAPVPAFEAGAAATEFEMVGMRDRALVYFDRKLYQTCGRGTTVDAVACTPASNASNARVAQIDILVENQGRVTGGLPGTELPSRGISHYISLNQQMLGNWTIAPLPLDNIQLLAPLWGSAAAPTASTRAPAFFRGEFSVGKGKVADTFLTLLGWGKGQAWINGNNLARYWSIGPQYSFLVPAGFLHEGQNEVILLETGGAPSNFTVQFNAAHTVVGPQPGPPPPPAPPLACPPGFISHASGLWSNPQPCGHYPSYNCTADMMDHVNVTSELCGRKCDLTKGCLAFEIFEVAPKSCYIFVGELQAPFYPVAQCFTCVRNSTGTTVHARPVSPRRQLAASTKPALTGFRLGNGQFLLNGKPIRLFAGSLQHFRIHPQHWEHRLALARAMGLNAVQTLIPWMMMEPRPGEFRTDGFMDIVQFAKLAQKAGLLIVLRPGPFICDGPDYGGFPWWLTQQNTPATANPDAPGALLRVRTADPAFLHRVDLFFTKLFALLRTEKLTADLGGPIVMAQLDNEYGLFSNDHEYLERIRDMWRKGLGDGVVIHSTDPASRHVLDASRIEGVLQTVDFATASDPAADFATLRASQSLVSATPQPLMVSEFYPGE